MTVDKGFKQWELDVPLAINVGATPVETDISKHLGFFFNTPKTFPCAEFNS